MKHAGLLTMAGFASCLALHPAAASDRVRELPEFVHLSGRQFLFGTNKPLDEPFLSEELPQEPMEVTPFEISRHETTEGLWDHCVTDAMCAPMPSRLKLGPGYPARNLSWRMIQPFLTWINTLDKRFTYRLPTEAEWEYAAKAGQPQIYWEHSRVSSNKVNVKGETLPGRPRIDRGLHAANLQEGNGYGLKGMLGGVAEWTTECWQLPADARRGLRARLAREDEDCGFAIARGGSFSANAVIARPTMRIVLPSHTASSNLGFRLVRTVRAP